MLLPCVVGFLLSFLAIGSATEDYKSFGELKASQMYGFLVTTPSSHRQQKLRWRCRLPAWWPPSSLCSPGKHSDWRVWWRMERWGGGVLLFGWWIQFGFLKIGLAKSKVPTLIKLLKTQLNNQINQIILLRTHPLSSRSHRAPTTITFCSTLRRIPSPISPSMQNGNIMYFARNTLQELY